MANKYYLKKLTNSTTSSNFIDIKNKIGRIFMKFLRVI